MGKYSTEGNADYRQSSGYRHRNNDEKICGDCIKLDTSEAILKITKSSISVPSMTTAWFRITTTPAVLLNRSSHELYSCNNYPFPVCSHS